MSPIYVPGKVVLAQTYVGLDDPDAAVYVAAVEAADGQSLETATKVAIHSFVKGCKADGIWPAIKASCILAGARTLTGALVPLVGSAPTPFNFVDADYNRKTGLVGDGSTKYLNSNRNADSQPQNNMHISVSINAAATIDAFRSYIASRYSSPFLDEISVSTSNHLFFRSRHESQSTFFSGGGSTGFLGLSRSSAASFTRRAGGADVTASVASSPPTAFPYFVFARSGSSPSLHANARLVFYSIGESIDLAKLDTRVTALINAIGAAIP